MSFIKSGNNISGKEYILDAPAQQETFLQFIPATVKQVVNSGESVASPSNNDNESNCIVVEKNIYTEEVTLNGLDVRKYRPLFRGLIDSITKGDLVLITIVGDVGYYMGPLNVTNTPSDTTAQISGLSTTKSVSKTYPTAANFNRLTKRFKPDLDDPLEKATRITDPTSGKTILPDIHTDLIIEGRHGNSIRVGSRNKFPSVVIDNGRATNQSFESINDSSIFAMFDRGSILNHFDPADENLDGQIYSFKFSDESIENPTSYIKKTFTAPLGRGLPIDGESDSDIEETIYNYSQPFSILNSERIIINARKENMFLSARKHIHIGSGDSLTFSTSKNTIFNSTGRFDINAPEVRLGSQVDEETQPIVLGDTLVQKIVDLCDQLDQLIKNITAITVPTTQGPSGTPINAAAFSSQTSGIRKVAESIDEILSVNRTI